MRHVRVVLGERGQDVLRGIAVRLQRLIGRENEIGDRTVATGAFIDDIYNLAAVHGKGERVTHDLVVPRCDRGVQREHAWARVHPPLSAAVRLDFRVSRQHRGLRARVRGATDVGFVVHERLLGGRIVGDPRAVDLERRRQPEGARLGTPPVVVALVVKLGRRETLDDIRPAEDRALAVVPRVFERHRIYPLPGVPGHWDDGLRRGAGQVRDDEERVRRVQGEFDRAIVDCDD